MTLTTLIQANPQIAIILISLIATSFVTAISYFFTDRKLMKEIKERGKAIREEMKKHRDNPQKMMELNKQLMEDFPKQMKQSMKVSLITIIPMLILFSSIRKVFVDTSIATSWIWWYIISSIVFSMILRKVFKID